MFGSRPSPLVSRFQFAFASLAILPVIFCCPTATAQATGPDPKVVADAQKKIDKLDADVSKANSFSDQAEAANTDLLALTDETSNRGELEQRLQAIEAKLKSLNSLGFTKTLTDAKASIAADETQLTCDAQTIGEPVATLCSNSKGHADDAQKRLDIAKDDLNKTLLKVVTYFSGAIQNSTGHLTGLDSGDTHWPLPRNRTASNFVSSVPQYAEACDGYKSLSSHKSAILTSLKSVGGDPAPDTSGVEKDLGALSQKLQLTDAAVANFATLFDAIKATTDDSASRVSASVTAVKEKPADAALAATDSAAQAGSTIQGVESLLRIWPSLKATLTYCGGNRDLTKAEQSLTALNNSKSALTEKLSLLNDALAGDASQFAEEAIQLYYYTEVEKLMRSLNERTDWAGGNSTAATQATTQRELLLDAESRVTQARGEVADLQFELQKLQEEQRRSEAALNQLGLLSQNLAFKKRLADGRANRAATELSKAQAAVDADPNTAAKKDRLQKAKDASTTATAQQTDASQKATTADTNYEAAAQKQSSANADKDSLQSRIALATSKLSEAQRNFEDMQRNAYRAALTESDAFAAARDQTPFLVAPPLAVAQDPIRRVTMRGYPDRNLIFIRGREDDVNDVKRIIARFDTPAPQARLTLWSTEISAELKKPFFWWSKPEDRLNEATAIVDAHIGLARAQMATATEALRQGVNAEVQLTEQGGELPSCSNPKIPPPPSLSPSQQAKWRRYRFYSPAVLIQAGVNMADAASFTSAILPDPAATTTVGEAIVILALTCKNYRGFAFRRFLDVSDKAVAAISSYQATQAQSGRNKNWENRFSKRPKPKSDKQFLGIRRALEIDNEDLVRSSRPSSLLTPEVQESIQKDLKARAMTRNRTAPAPGVNPDNLEEVCPPPLIDTEILTLMDVPNPLVPPSEGLSDLQLEIVRALHAGATRAVFEQMAALRKQVYRVNYEYGEFRKALSNFTYRVYPQEVIKTCLVKTAEVESLYNSYNAFVNTRLRLLSPLDYRQFQLTPYRLDYDLEVARQEKENLLKLSQASPRVAAADEMLKRIMTSLEDDLDEQYIQPMLKQLRSDLIKEGLTVGIIQRTSVLATNRLKARVDPKGMYDLSVGEQQDLLASVGQLASVYLTAQTGGALAAFGSLNSLKQKQEARLYGITTGSKFEVTPIFDPSGQALRFKFDYVSNSLVRNPKGTVDPSMPSIRHTVNTEVQLTNLEIREISRYESNAKLGIPTRYYGGIPLLTDIPGFKPIPLIGWFVRRAGSNAEAQQTVVFGQTTIYPTIDSIVKLLQTGN